MNFDFVDDIDHSGTCVWHFSFKSVKLKECEKILSCTINYLFDISMGSQNILRKRFKVFPISALLGAPYVFNFKIIFLC